MSNEKQQQRIILGFFFRLLFVSPTFVFFFLYDFWWLFVFGDEQDVSKHLLVMLFLIKMYSFLIGM